MNLLYMKTAHVETVALMSLKTVNFGPDMYYNIIILCAEITGKLPKIMQLKVS